MSRLPPDQKVFQDLPSEHWEELVGTWLCHDEMKLDLGGREGGGGGSETKGGGWWPRDGEVLVGGGYILVRGDLMREGSWRQRASSDVSHPPPPPPFRSHLLQFSPCSPLPFLPPPAHFL